MRIRLMSQPKGKPSEDAPEKALTERVKETGGTVLDRLIRQYFQLSPQESQNMSGGVSSNLIRIPLNFMKKHYPPGVSDYLSVNKDLANQWPQLRTHKIKENSMHTRERVTEANHRRQELEDQLRTKQDVMARRKQALRMLVSLAHHHLYRSVSKPNMPRSRGSRVSPASSYTASSPCTSTARASTRSSIRRKSKSCSL